MTTATYTYDDLPFQRFLYYSVFFHLTLSALMIVSIWAQRSGNAWGGVGGGNDSGVKVNLVPSAGIPMPPNINPTESQAFDPTKGLNVELPKPKPPEPPTDATKIPKFEKEKPLPPSKKSRVFEPKTPPPDNAVNYGKGGSPSIPSSYSNSPGPLNGGVAVQGPGGGGDFAARYAWYVEAVRRNIS